MTCFEPISVQAADAAGSTGYMGIGKGAANSPVDIDLPTEDLQIVDAGSDGATAQDWIQVTVGAVTGYIRVYASK